MRSRRLLWFPALVAAALMLVVAACGDEETETQTETTPTVVATAGASPTQASAGQSVKLSAVPRNKFDTDRITVAAGNEVTLIFSNEDDGVPHNWAAYTDSTATDLIPGAITDICNGPCEEQITFTAPSEPGEYFFRCDVHPTTMTGTLVVE